MTIEEAMAVATRGRLEALYVLAGPNRFWRVEWLKIAQKTFLGHDASGSAVRLENVMDFRDIELELASGGLFEPRKVVIVDQCRWNKREDTIKKYLDHPVPDTLLILLEDKVAPALERLVGSHRYVEMSVLTATAFRRFVQQHAEELHIQWDSAAREKFCRLVDGNEYLAMQELNKLSLLFQDKIGVQDIMETVLPIVGEDKPWDVTDAMLRRDGPQVLRLIYHHLNRGLAPLLLFIIMARQIIQLDQARRAAQRGMSLIQFQQEAGLKDFVAKKAWGARSRWNDADELKRLLDWAFKIDVAMKTGYGEPELWLIFWTGLWAEHKNPPGVLGGGRMSRT